MPNLRDRRTAAEDVDTCRASAFVGGRASSAQGTALGRLQGIGRSSAGPARRFPYAGIVRIRLWGSPSGISAFQPLRPPSSGRSLPLTSQASLRLVGNRLPLGETPKPTRRQGNAPQEWWALRSILDVYSPLSIGGAASIAGWFELGHGPLGQVCMFSTRRAQLGQSGRDGVSDRSITIAQPGPTARASP